MDLAFPLDMLLCTRNHGRCRHIVVTKDPEHSYFLTRQVEVILRVINDICITARNTVTRDVLFDWEYNLKKAEELDFNLKWLRQKIDAIRKAVEGDAPFTTSDAVLNKMDEAAELTKKLEAEKAALQVLEDAEKQKSYFADFF